MQSTVSSKGGIVKAALLQHPPAHERSWLDRSPDPPQSSEVVEASCVDDSQQLLLMQHDRSRLCVGASVGASEAAKIRFSQQHSTIHAARAQTRTRCMSVEAVMARRDPSVHFRRRSGRGSIEISQSTPDRAVVRRQSKAWQSNEPTERTGCAGTRGKCPYWRCSTRCLSDPCGDGAMCCNCARRRR